MNHVWAREMVDIAKAQAASATRLVNNVERLEDALPLLKRQAVALERIAKALEDLYRNVEMSTEPENLGHPGHATVFKVRRYE